jgi:hypothetical protein
MSKEQQLAVIDFGPADLRTLDEIASQVNACKQASDKAGRAAQRAHRLLEDGGREAFEFRERPAGANEDRKDCVNETALRGDCASRRA